MEREGHIVDIMLDERKGVGRKNSLNAKECDCSILLSTCLLLMNRTKATALDGLEPSSLSIVSLTDVH